jgi:hypothetical protein
MLKRFIPLLFIFAGLPANAAILTYTSNTSPLSYHADGYYFTAVADVTSIGPGIRDYPGGGLSGVEFRLFNGNDVEIWGINSFGSIEFSEGNFIEFDATGAVIDWYLQVEFCGANGYFESSSTYDNFVPFGGCADGYWQFGTIDNPGTWESDTVLAPSTEEQITNLVNDVISLNLKKGISNALDAKLDNVLRALQDENDNNDVAAINGLYAFCSSVDAQSGKKVTEEDAATLIASANGILSSIDDLATHCQ